MNIVQNGYDTFTLLIVVVASSFFGSFAKELNDIAKNNENFLLFISEILLNGLSGTIIGILVSQYIVSNLLIVMAASATSGIMGVTFLNYVLRVAILLFGKVKEIDLGEIKDIKDDLNDKD